MENKRVVVTGGAGFIGSHIVDRLVADGYEVVVYDDLSAGYMHNIEHLGDTITFVRGCVADLAALQEACAGASAIIHHAAVASVPKSIEFPIETHGVNVTGTLNVFEVARELGIKRVIYTSSSAVYGDEPTLPKVETMERQPLSPYALHKSMNEQYAKLYTDLYGLETVGMCYFNVFGPRQDPSSQYSGVISIFAERIPKGEGITVFGDGETTRDFIYVDDVVEANMRALTADITGSPVYNIASGKQTSLNELVEKMSTACGVEAKVTHADARPGEVRHSLASIEKAHTELGFAPEVDFLEGLRRTLAD